MVSQSNQPPVGVDGDPTVGQDGQPSGYDPGDGSSGGSSNPPATRLVIDYSLLYEAAKDIENLKPIADKMRTNIPDRADDQAPKSSGGGGSGRRIDLVVHSPGGGESDEWFTQGSDEQGTIDGLGIEVVGALRSFGNNWSGPMRKAADDLTQLGGFFKSCAYTFQETDAAMAAGLNLGATMSAIMNYADEMSRYQDRPTPGSPGYDPNAQPPGAVPNPYSLTGNTGALNTTYTYQGDDPYAPTDGDTGHQVPNKLLSSETTTATGGGMTYKETTTFGPDKGWGPDGPTQDTTQTVTGPDGSTQTITTTVDPKTGAGTRTVTDDDGTTTATRPDWTSDWA